MRFATKEYLSPKQQAVAFGGLLVMAFTFCYAGVWIALAGQWWSNDMYSYGFLVPAISLYLVWINRDKQ